MSEYLQHYDASKAARAAGYSTKSAGKIGYDLLQKSLIQTAIQQVIDEKLKIAGVTAERVLIEAARVGQHDIRKLFDRDGRLKPPQEWDDATAAAVASVQVFEEFDGHGNKREKVGQTRKVRMLDKARALEMLAKHMHLLNTNVTITGENGKPIVVHFHEEWEDPPRVGAPRGDRTSGHTPLPDNG